MSDDQICSGCGVMSGITPENDGVCLCGGKAYRTSSQIGASILSRITLGKVKAEKMTCEHSFCEPDKCYVGPDPQPAPAVSVAEARDNIVDEIESIINETHDMDVRDRDYAENVVGWLERHHPAALAAMQPGPLKPLDKADDPALNWVIKNCTAIRRDNGAMEYNLTQMVRAFQAGAATVNKENTDD